MIKCMICSFLYEVFVLYTLRYRRVCFDSVWEQRCLRRSSERLFVYMCSRLHRTYMWHRYPALYIAFIANNKIPIVVNWSVLINCMIGLVLHKFFVLYTIRYRRVCFDSLWEQRCMCRSSERLFVYMCSRLYRTYMWHRYPALYIAFIANNKIPIIVN